MVDAAEINADGCRLTSMNKPIAQIDQFSNRDDPDDDGNVAQKYNDGDNFKMMMLAMISRTKTAA